MKGTICGTLAITPLSSTGASRCYLCDASFSISSRIGTTVRWLQVHKSSAFWPAYGSNETRWPLAFLGKGESGWWQVIACSIRKWRYRLPVVLPWRSHKGRAVTGIACSRLCWQGGLWTTMRVVAIMPMREEPGRDPGLYLYIARHRAVQDAGYARLNHNEARRRK